MKALIDKLFGTRHERTLKEYRPLVDEINEIGEELQELSEDELKGKTDEFKEYIRERIASTKEELQELRAKRAETVDTGEREALSQKIGDAEGRLTQEIHGALDDLLPEAFAVAREACRRLLGTEYEVTGQKTVWDMVPYDVQVMGAIALHRGSAAEMATGEGKTLVATMPLYLNALAERGAHLVTVNPYLAQRDAEWMGLVYDYLGLTVDVLDLHKPGSEERRQAYRADITYGTNNEFGFDYLRDNMVHSLEQRVQREHFYVIIDEVDSILIDEARTPLIISGPVGKDTQTPYKEHKGAVAELYRKQLNTTSELIAEAEEELEAEEGDTYKAGQLLLAAKRGTPKNKRLLKLFADDPSLQKLVQKVEMDYMREKRLHELDEYLYYAMDEKGQNVHLTDHGLDELSPGDPETFTVPDLSELVGEIQEDEELTPDEKQEEIQELEKEYSDKAQRMHVVHQLLKAYTLFHRDEQYIMGEDGSVVIVDAFTGRQMPGRRWSDGLHQAVEAKEGVEIKGETQTMATITIQNYFRMYDKLSGMTGTAETEESEFYQIYNLDVVVVPTHRPVIRDDRDDLIFRTVREKYNALIEEVERLHRMELPVLVGTTNVEVSETISRMLKRTGIKHNVLNAKHHAREAEIIAEAGHPGAVTIATNMAGRGTDIKLGEGVTESRTVGWARERGLDPEELLPVDPSLARKVNLDDEDSEIECGGLHVLGSARHESRRIDRQLRGRSGRQGDPGASQFFLSLEDDLMRKFGSDRIAGTMEKMGAQEGEIISHGLVTRSIERAQKRVETNNFEARKKLLDYDDVMNQQREVIYDLRLFALEGGEDLKGEVWEMVETAVIDLVQEYTPEDQPSDMWDLAGLRQRLLMDLFISVEDLPATAEEEHDFYDQDEVLDPVLERAREQFDRKIESFGDHAERLQSWLLLSVIDDKWKDHLYDLDHLKASIAFRGWGQKDPLIEYKKEAYNQFVSLMKDVRKTVTNLFFRAQIGQKAAEEQRQRVAGQQGRLVYSGPQETAGSGAGSAAGDMAHRAPTQPAAGQGRRQQLDPTGISASARQESAEPSGDEVARAAAGAAGAPTGQPDPSQLRTNRGESQAQQGKEPVTVENEPGRNDPCSCGSGKKYKKCCMRTG